MAARRRTVPASSRRCQRSRPRRPSPCAIFAAVSSFGEDQRQAPLERRVSYYGYREQFSGLQNYLANTATPPWHFHSDLKPQPGSAIIQRVELDANAENVTGLLVVALALVTIAFLLKKKYDSNLPLLFYFVALMFTNMSSLAVNPYLMITGLALAMVLRFEFMGADSQDGGVSDHRSAGADRLCVLFEIFGTGQAPF